jgi:hypothetical protein
MPSRPRQQRESETRAIAHLVELISHSLVDHLFLHRMLRAPDSTRSRTQQRSPLLPPTDRD